MSEIDSFYLKQEEPIKSCMLALREILLSLNNDIQAQWKYGMPFFCYKDKMLCYLWVHKKLKMPYLGVVEGKYINHPDLIMEKRSRMKILLINPNADIPIQTISEIVGEAILRTEFKLKAK